MKKQIAIALAALLPVAVLAGDPTNQERLEKSKAAIQDFGGTLKGELEKAMKEGGPLQAIKVCNTVAPHIATAKSQAHNMELARTSLKFRNPGNAPDEWETSVLRKFEERKAAGEEVDKIAYAEVVDKDGVKTFRFMKAIPTGEVCLLCHGETIAPAVAAELDKLYPGDKARGYKLGDIRGAFTVKQKM